MRVRAYLSALPALLKDRVDAEVYRAYITDAAKIIAENTERVAGGGHLKDRYLNIITPQKEETRTGEEIVSQVLRALGGGQAESV